MRSISSFFLSPEDNLQPFPQIGFSPSHFQFSLSPSLSLSHGRAGQLDGGARRRTRAAPAVARSGARRSRARTGEPRPARSRLGGQARPRLSGRQPARGCRMVAVGPDLGEWVFPLLSFLKIHFRRNPNS